ITGKGTYARCLSRARVLMVTGAAPAPHGSAVGGWRPGLGRPTQSPAREQEPGHQGWDEPPGRTTLIDRAATPRFVARRSPQPDAAITLLLQTLDHLRLSSSGSSERTCRAPPSRNAKTAAAASGSATSDDSAGDSKTSDRPGRPSSAKPTSHAAGCQAG